MSSSAVRTKTTTTQKTLPDGKIQTIIKKEITTTVDGEEKTEVQEEVVDGATGLFDEPPEEEKKRIPQSLVALRNEALKTHNELRAKHGVEPLKVSKDLDKLAQEWAEKLAQSGEFEHRPDCPYGECLYGGLRTTGAVITGKEVVDQWYGESKTGTDGNGYDYDSTEFSPRTGHFTQVIWKASERVGFGYVRSEEGKVYVVANYDPAGNVKGKFTENVLRPKEVTDEEEAPADPVEALAAEE